MVISDYNFQTPFTDPQGRLSGRATEWLFGPATGAALAIVQALGLAVARAVAPVTVAAAASGTIATTAFPLSTFPGGQYRASWYLQIITPDGAGSSAQVTIGWTSAGQALTASGAAVTGDTVTTFQSLGTGILDVDAGSPITWSVTYSSTTPAKMKYKLVLVLENVGS